MKKPNSSYVLLWLALLFISFGTGFKASGQQDPEEVIHFFQTLYQYELDEARQELDQIKLQYGHTDYFYLCASNYYWWQLVSGNDGQENELAFHRNLDQLIDKYENTPPNDLNDDQLFNIIHAFAYRTRLAMHHHHYLQGILYLNRALPFLDRILATPEKNEKFRMLAGLYHYMAASSFEKYPITRPILRLAPKGELDLGYRLLHEAAQSEHPLLRTEALYFLMKIDLELSKNPKAAMEWTQDLLNTYPKNLIYQYHALVSLRDQGNMAGAKAKLETIRSLSQSMKSLTPQQSTHIVSVSERYYLKQK